MPKQGQSVESCIIAKWHKKKGDTVAEGDVLFTYETDKATFDEEAKVAGILLDVFFEEGDDVPCLTNVCAIGKEGNTTAELRPDGAESEAAPAPAPAAEAPKAAVAAVATASAGSTKKISPRARGLAARRGVDPSMATPTGPNGRIIERDVQALVDSGQGFLSAAADGFKPGMVGTGIGGRVRVEDLTAVPEAPKATSEAPAAAAVSAPVPEVEEVKIPNIRKVIARSMHASLSEMAQLTLNSSFDAAEIMAYRSKVKNNMETLGLANITLNDIILYAVSRVLKNHRDLNAHFTGDTMRYFNVVNLGMAVDTPRGLMVPTIFGADSMSLNEISVKAKELAKACQAGTISPDLLQGGSFTITNLGSMGIESFTPVINPPQTGILGVDTITTGVREVGGELKPYKKMGLSLTFDHRAVDGAPAARFLQELTKVLENFSILLAK
ncbi:MAG: 2-oxo acid dehydrogenase subunit E2 [Clostridia bacterium]|nr:2-oxo acid dehydrogenase subunit E2 [Clostridia bacterium]